MKTMLFTFDGHDYFIINADDDQHEPRHMDTIVDSADTEVCYVTHDGEYWVAEDTTRPTFVAVHENEDEAVWTAVKACIAGQY